MNALLVWLSQKLSFVTDSKSFNWLFGVIVFINPIALAPAAYKAVTAPSVQGISVSSYLMFGILQIAFALFGIKHKDWRMFVAMVLSIVLNMIVVIAAIARS